MPTTARSVAIAIVTVLVLIVTLPSAARADDEEPPPTPTPTPTPIVEASSPSPPRPAPPPYVPEPAPKAPPLGQTGFQLALRTGVAIPMGRTKHSNEISDKVQPGGPTTELNERVSLQLPITVDIGAKPNKHIFIGGYFGFGFGKDLSSACRDPSLDCSATTVRLGAQIHYAIAPNEWVNPWVGYGFGYSWLSVGDAESGYLERLRGFEIVHLLAGVDFRLSRTIGIGPFLDFSVGSYAHREIKSAGRIVVDDEIDHEAFHHWFMVGPRVVLFP